MKRFKNGENVKINGRKADVFSLAIVALLLSKKSLKARDLTNIKDGY
jgi:hypothetical protein